jgi:bifunctional oligoribonuclease and PAP phosphatase NrnA
VSLRGKGDVNVQRIAAKFGGGGHPNAAGFSVPGSLDAVTRDVLAAVAEAMRA